MGRGYLLVHVDETRLVGGSDVAGGQPGHGGDAGGAVGAVVVEVQVRRAVPPPLHVLRQGRRQHCAQGGPPLGPRRPRPLQQAVLPPQVPLFKTLQGTGSIAGCAGVRQSDARRMQPREARLCYHFSSEWLKT